MTETTLLRIGAPEPACRGFSLFPVWLAASARETRDAGDKLRAFNRFGKVDLEARQQGKGAILRASKGRKGDCRSGPALILG